MNDQEKEKFLLENYCDDEIERAELKDWIKLKGISEAYYMVHEVFMELEREAAVAKEQNFIFDQKV